MDKCPVIFHSQTHTLATEHKLLNLIVYHNKTTNNNNNNT